MIDDTKVSSLLERARREYDAGHLPAVQVAIGYEGEVVVEEAFGASSADRFVIFSCSKALVGAAVWQLVGEGLVDLTAPVADYVPSFATNGKEAVTVEQVLLHVGGFPYAPLGPGTWETRESRHEAFSRWRLTLTPGETFMYHPTSAHWVVADIVEEVTGEPYGDALHRRITEPLGLPRLLGIPADQQDGILDAVAVGELPTPEEVEAAFGIRLDLAALVPPDVSLNALLTLNEPDARALGVPGGGGVARAADLVRLYQAFLHDPAGLWDPAVLADATGVVRNRLPDMLGIPANRTRGGLVVKGDDERAGARGMGHTASARAFGHNGAGGQIAFADPETGLSVAYLTSGMDQNPIREHRRTAGIASRAASVLKD